jgi:hypothetical protein
MTLPARPQTFALETAWDVYAKLEWEIDGLKAAPLNQNPRELAYRAFNCAVTAWQLSDWVWEEMTATPNAAWWMREAGRIRRGSSARAADTRPMPTPTRQSSF